VHYLLRFTFATRKYYTVRSARDCTRTRQSSNRKLNSKITRPLFPRSQVASRVRTPSASSHHRSFASIGIYDSRLAIARRRKLSRFEYRGQEKILNVATSDGKKESRDYLNPNKRAPHAIAILFVFVSYFLIVYLPTL